RLKLLALVAAAPLIWAVSDLLVTGDALWSFHGTHDIAAHFRRDRGLGKVPGVLKHQLGLIMRRPELIASGLGIVAGLVLLLRRVALPIAVGALNGVGFCVLALGGL